MSANTRHAESQAAKDLRDFIVEIHLGAAGSGCITRRVYISDDGVDAREVARLIRGGRSDITDVTRNEGDVFRFDQNDNKVVVARWKTEVVAQPDLDEFHIYGMTEHGRVNL